MLVRGLSINSATITHLQQIEIGSKGKQDEVLIDGTPEEVDRAFDMLFRPPIKVERKH